MSLNLNKGGDIMKNTIYMYFKHGTSDKFYDMIDNGDETFTAHWGRCRSIGQQKIFPMDLWFTKLFSKEDKGYEHCYHSYGAYED